jgi:hypothetical protein
LSLTPISISTRSSPPERDGAAAFRRGAAAGSRFFVGRALGFGFISKSRPLSAIVEGGQNIIKKCLQIKH